jgi:hypothetical protein
MPELLIDPMKGRLVAKANGVGLPAGAYTAEFINCEYLPAKEPDPMTGKGGRQWACYRFSWRVIGGEHDSQTAYRETPCGTTPVCDFAKVCAWITGKPIDGDFDLYACVGKRYRISVSQKVNKAGVATNYFHVSSCVAL